MKKIFITMAAVALGALAANAEVKVTYNGAQLENGAEIKLDNKSFHLNEDLLAGGIYYWETEVKNQVTSNGPVAVEVTCTTMTDGSFCTDTTCLPFKDEDGVYRLSYDYDKSDFEVMVHFNYMEENLPAVNEKMTITFTDKDKVPFTYYITVKTEDSGVEEIMADATVAAVYDMQGRRVRDDFRGAAIVVYSDGKAVKRIIK